MKIHAKDYLNEFKNSQPLWMQELIDEAINTNGQISDENLERIYDVLKTGKSNKQKISKPLSVDTTDKLIIKKLKHNCGVNALAKAQSITFNENCNVLFGLNGSGKSSYFRILNELAGGNEKKDIVPNIYLNDQSDISVDIDYLIGLKTDTLNWINTSREISPFNTIRVFDSSYLNGLLSKREIDSTLIEPFGLNLFSYIIDTIDKFKKKLSDEIQVINNKKPKINNEKFSSQIKSIFEQNYLDNVQQKNIENKYDFLDKYNKRLNDLKTEYQNLSQQNIQDKIKLETTKYEEINTIKRLVEDVSKSINPYTEKVKNTVGLYKKYELESNEFKKQIEVLKTLPSTDSNKWKSFITSASIYSKDIENSDNTCVYCRQPLGSAALDIVQAYSKYLNNESEIQLNNTIKEIEIIYSNIKKIDLRILINEDIAHLFRDKNLIGEAISIDTNINQFNKQFEQLKNKLLSSLSKKELVRDLPYLDCQNLVTSIDKILQDIGSSILKLKSDNKTKKEELKKIEGSIAPLEENKLISQQKEQIIKWITLGKQIKDLENKINSTNTRSLSNLSKEAHNQLLTENLKSKFEEELKIIGLNSHEVKLEGAGVSKGKSQTKLSLKTTDKISSILSEGEQKAVALSIFIAEIRMQSQSNPIIFDDPVNSLDHKIASKFAQRILKLDNQTIVFTHNKLFLDAFETAKSHHVCKNYDGGCSNNSKPHIYLYSVQSEGKSSKGIVLPKKIDKAETHLDDVNKYLSESPFSKYNECANKLRKAVECIIDEVVFNGLVPTKYSSKINRIHWDSLKNMIVENEFIDKLHEVHDRVSGGEIHNGTESDENPIDKEEFERMVRELENLMSKD
ncbi:AAA family ATPase [Francisella salimarina]|uniref:Protein CR006 P-loop domain-containing protein n=1 Tax=Francisella salimarina TaxID=2599927 RepID=A0AAJ4NQT7_9GAMM|nr:hypothetical protein [Francisella salimarina]QWV00072.1 hypothetical protein KQR59_04095 [Francisella salimarina]